MRATAPVTFVPELGATLFTRRDDIFEQEKRVEVFSSHQRRLDDNPDGRKHDAQGWPRSRP